jgi:DNA-binding NarL/FixJ family response regulator
MCCAEASLRGLRHKPETAPAIDSSTANWVFRIGLERRTFTTASRLCWVSHTADKLQDAAEIYSGAQTIHVRKILIADDSEPMRRLHRQLAEQCAGWTICGEALNGRQAVQMAGALKPDLIVLDLAMPELDGIHAAQQILKTTPAVPIVLYTLHDMPHIKVEAAKVGIREVVFKTADANDLARVIKKLLNDLPARPSSIADSAPPLFTGAFAESTFEATHAASATPAASAEMVMSASTETAPSISEPTTAASSGESSSAVTESSSDSAPSSAPITEPTSSDSSASN